MKDEHWSRQLARCMPVLPVWLFVWLFVWLLGMLPACAPPPVAAPNGSPSRDSAGVTTRSEPIAAETGDRSEPSGHEARLALCADVLELGNGSRDRVIHLGWYQNVDVFQLADGNRDLIVAAGKLRPVGPAECSVQQPLEWQTPVPGAFWPHGAPVQAMLLGPDECTPERCPTTTLIRSSDRPLGAVFLPYPCNEGVFLNTRRWFTGQDSLALTCHQSAGAAYRERLVILHVTAQGLVPILERETGMAEHASQEERESPGFCERRPVGWVRLLEAGDRPAIRIFDPTRGQAGVDGKGKGLLADFRFDPEQLGFEQVSPGTLVDYDARAWCTGEQAR